MNQFFQNLDLNEKDLEFKEILETNNFLVKCIENLHKKIEELNLTIYKFQENVSTYSILINKILNKRNEFIFLLNGAYQEYNYLHTRWFYYMYKVNMSFFGSQTLSYNYNMYNLNKFSPIMEKLRILFK